MIKVISQSTQERQDEFNRKYAEYKELFYTTELPAEELYKKICVGPSSALAREIHCVWLKNGEVTPQKRGHLIRFKRWL